MRVIENKQMQIGQQDISEVKIELRTRDDVPQLLRGLQEIYCNVPIRKKVFKVLNKIVPQDVDSKNGRPGMNLWKIFVLGVLRLNLNWDYDRLLEMATNHITIRQILGHGLLDDMKGYKLQTLKDNVSLLTPSVLDEINQIVVGVGHNLVKKKEEEKLHGKCDSFVVETNVHFPTDINLLFDAMRKVVSLLAGLCLRCGLTMWRQSEYNVRQIKRLFNIVRKLKRSNSKNPSKKKDCDEKTKEAYESYLKFIEVFLKKAEETIQTIEGMQLGLTAEILLIQKYIIHAYRQIDQIRRRVIGGEKIPHDEKIFSIFEEHTEWISKGKAGVPVELGIRVCIVDDQYGFILNHQVMENQTDDQVAVSIVKEVREKFPSFSLCSFDKGYHSPSNQQELNEILENVVLPKKGRLSEADKDREYSDIFLSSRRQHSAVESAINALEVHGLDKCPDHGIDGFKRYVALAVVGRNIQKLGTILIERERKAENHRLKKVA